MMKEHSRLHVIGEINNPKIMLIHGVGFYWETCFTRIVETLADKYCVLLPELEGHCYEPMEYISSAVESAAKIIEEMKEKNVEQVEVLYGISLGASIALEIAMKNEITISHLILDGGRDDSSVFQNNGTAVFEFIKRRAFDFSDKREHGLCRQERCKNSSAADSP